jgi:hypothetical protein
VVVAVTSEKVSALGLGYRYIKGSLVPGTAASQASVIALGACNRFEPARLSDATTVVQTLELFR